jgi:hypothetical protein
MRGLLRHLFAGTIAASLWSSLQELFSNIEEKICKHSEEIDLAAQADQMRMISDGMHVP